MMTGETVLLMRQRISPVGGAPVQSLLRRLSPGVSAKYLYSHRPKRQRQRCPACGRLVAIDPLGRYARHGVEHGELGACGSSGAVALAQVGQREPQMALVRV